MMTNIFGSLVKEVSEKLKGLSDNYVLKRLPTKNTGSEDLIVSINGYQYFRISDSTKGGIRISLARTPFELPNYSILIQRSFIQFFDNNERKKIEWVSYSKLIDEYFAFPNKMEEEKLIICQKAKDILNIDIDTDNVEFDLRTKKYYFTDWKEEDGIENNLFKAYFEIKNDQRTNITLAKYTSFSTLIKILESGMIRMNSIVGMNDRTELNFINQFLYDDDVITKYNNYSYESYYYANQRFITSFTENIDDLNMWRLYGDNLKGVCLVFEHLNQAVTKPSIYPVCYADENNKTIAILMKNYLDELKKHQILFSFNSLKKWQNFFKSRNYNYENEYRLLIEKNKPSGWMISPDYGILTPYIEIPLKKSLYSPLTDGNFPMYLSGVILGSNMKAKEENEYQIYSMINNLELPLISISMSKEKTYR